MSNTGFSFFQDLCSLKFLKSSELHKTSLNRPQRLSPQIEKNDLEAEPNYSSKDQKELKDGKKFVRVPSKRETEVPASSEKEKVSVTEKDFRIMQVCFQKCLAFLTQLGRQRRHKLPNLHGQKRR